MGKIYNTILNIAAGKIQPLDLDKVKHQFLVNLDTMYYAYDTPETIEMQWQTLSKVKNYTYHCKEDAFEFMERTKITFDRVVMYRFLEHVPFDRLLYFIYLVSTVTKSGGIVDVIVPNYKILAKMIEDEYPYDKDFEANNVLLTTELLNEPGCPHASIWTPMRAFYFWKLENRFEIEQEEMFEQFEFDGRDIYMRFLATRV